MTALYWMIRHAARAGLTTLGGFDVVNPEKRIESGGAIIAANHASYLDPPIVAAAYQREIVFLARKTLFTGFGGWLYPKLNAFPIDRDQADLGSMKGILRRLKEGNRVLIFPEGTRTRDGALQSAKAGIGLLVAKSGVPVQPVRLFGSFDAWPREGKFRPHKFTVVIGDPIEFSKTEIQGKSREAYQSIADRMMEAIGRLELP